MTYSLFVHDLSPRPIELRQDMKKKVDMTFLFFSSKKPAHNCEVTVPAIRMLPNPIHGTY